jgi:hypothetical protein
MQSSWQLAECISWRLVTELWRRFPDRYVLLETHPGGGQYDCLCLAECHSVIRPVVDVNRQGSTHVHTDGVLRSWPDWCDRMLMDSIGFLDEITCVLDLATPAPLPPSTPSTIALRFISEFLTHAVGRLDHWECRNGFYDTSGDLGGPRNQWFCHFPGMALDHPPNRLRETRLAPAYGYWFLLKSGEPLIGFDVDGRLHLRSGQSHDLATSYARNRAIWPLIAESVLEYLP